jgi:hypothetical protein
MIVAFSLKTIIAYLLSKTLKIRIYNTIISLIPCLKHRFLLCRKNIYNKILRKTSGCKKYEPITDSGCNTRRNFAVLYRATSIDRK